MLQLSRSPLQRYGVVVIAVFLSLLLLPLWGTKAPFLVFIPAIMFSAWPDVLLCDMGNAPRGWLYAHS